MSDYSELKGLAEASIQAWDQHSKADSHKFHAAWCAAEEAFSMAAREEAVLALIAENDRQASQFKEWQASHHANYCKVADERDQLKAENETLRLRCDRLDADKVAMAETHVLYTWLRKKVDQPSNDFVAVQMSIGHDWVPVHDLDRDLRSMIEREEP